MFRCERTGEVSAPRQPQTIIVVETRDVVYERLVDGETVQSFGTEIVRELRVAVPLASRVPAKPVIMKQGKTDATEIARHRAMREQRTVFVSKDTTLRGVLYEVTPQGDVRELAPIGFVTPVEARMAHKLREAQDRPRKAQNIMHHMHIVRLGALVAAARQWIADQKKEG